MEIEHKGYKILFRVDSETWFNELIGEKTSLKAAKAAIDGLSRKDRHIGLVALRLGDGLYRPVAAITEVTVTTFAEPKVYGWKKDAKPKIEECFITVDKSREKVSISNLYPVESRPELLNYVRLKKEAIKAEEAADAALKAIIPFDIDTIALAAKEQRSKKDKS